MNSLSSENLVQFGDIIYLNLDQYFLLADSRNAQPYFTQSVNKQKIEFRRCLFQILPQLEGPLSSIVQKATKKIETIKQNDLFIFYHLESQQVLSVSNESNKKLVLVNKISDNALFQFSGLEDLTKQGEHIQYNLPIQIRSKATGESLQIGDEDKSLKPSTKFGTIPSFESNFPKVFPRQDFQNSESDRYYPVECGDYPSTFLITRFQSSQAVQQQRETKTVFKGEFVRIRSFDKWLTHYPGQENKEEVFFERINDPFQPFNSVHSLFQVMSSDSTEATPLEVGNQNKYYLRHYLTGKVIHFISPADLAAYDEIAITEYDTPYFYFEGENDCGAVEEKSSYKIQYFNDQGYETCLKVAESKPVKQVQFEINTVYYFGFKIPEDYAYKNGKNLIRHRAGISTEFEIESRSITLEKVQPEDLNLILRAERFFQQLINFISEALVSDPTIARAQILSTFVKNTEKLLRNCQEINQLLLLNEREEIAGEGIQQQEQQQESESESRYQLNVPKRKSQNLIREFRIFDLIHFLNYSLVATTLPLFAQGGPSEKNEGKLLLKLYEEFASIIMNSLDQNPASRFYNSQFIRVYINIMVDSCFGSIHKILPEGVETVKKITLDLLKLLLWENDLDALGQINYYLSPFNNGFSKDSPCIIYYMQLLEHINQTKASNFINTIRENFIENYITSTISRALPIIVLEGEGEELFIKFQKANLVDLPLSLLPLNEFAQDYFIAALRLLISLATTKVKQFFYKILEQYPIDTLDAILKSDTSIEIKMLVHAILLSIHLNYIKHPFPCLPYAIQTSVPEVKELFDVEEEKNVKFNDNLIGAYEKNIHIEEGFGDDIEKIQNFVKDGASHMANYLLEIVLNSSGSTTTSQSQIQIILLYIETVLEKSDVNLNLLESMKKVLKGLIKTSLKNEKNELSFLPKILEVWELILKKAEIQLVISISQQIQSENNPETTRNFCQKLIEKYQLELLELIAPFDLISSNEPKVSNSIFPILQRISEIQKTIVTELEQFVLVSSTEEFSKIQKIMEISRELHRYGRSFSIEAANSDHLTIHYENYLVFVELLEELFVTIYDTSKHQEREKADRSKEYSPSELQERKVQFIKDYRKQKESVRDNPFVVDPNCISPALQRVLHLLSVPDSLLVLLNICCTIELTHLPAVVPVNSNYSVRIILANLIAFVYKNKRNQDFLSENPLLIRKYYEQSFLDKSTDSLILFAEILRDNETLLELSKKFIYDITCYSFLGTLKPRNFHSGGTYFCATFLAMHYLYKANLPLSVYDSFSLIDKRIKEILTDSMGEVDVLKKLKADNNNIELNYVYYCIREALRSSVKITKQAKSEGKEKQINEFRNSFSCHKLLEGLMKPDYYFTFELKNLILQFFEKVHFSAKNDINPSFLHIEDFSSALKLFVCLYDELFEFLQFSPTNPQKDAIQKTYQSYVKSVENMKGNIVDEDINAGMKGVREEYQVFTKQNITQRKFRTYLTEVTVFEMWQDSYILDTCWKFLAKLCVYYPDIVKVTELFETFLSVTMYLIQSTSKSNKRAFEMFKKYLTILGSTTEYESFKTKIQGLVSLANSSLKKPNQQENQLLESNENKNSNVVNFVESLKSSAQHDTEENLNLYVSIIRNHSKKNVIFSQLLTAISSNPFDLPKDLFSLVVRLFRQYLGRVVADQKYGEIVQVKDILAETNALRRLVKGVLIVKNSQNMEELFELILFVASEFYNKENAQRHLVSLFDELMQSKEDVRKYENQIDWVLKEMSVFAQEVDKNNQETAAILKYLCESHDILTDSNNDEFRGLTNLPVEEKIVDFNKMLQSITQEQIKQNSLLKSLGPLPICRETIQEIFIVHENDSILMKKVKGNLQNSLAQPNTRGNLQKYFAVRVKDNSENLEQIKLEGVLLLNLYVSIINKLE